VRRRRGLSHGRGQGAERREAVRGDGAAAGGVLGDVHRLRGLPEARHEPLRPRRVPQPRRHRAHGALCAPLREEGQAQDDEDHLPQGPGARRARVRYVPTFVLRATETQKHLSNSMDDTVTITERDLH
jgi:hypothetical protein